MPGGIASRIWGAKWLRSAIGDAVIAILLTAAAAAALPWAAAGGSAKRAEVTVPGGGAQLVDLTRDGVTSVPGALGEVRLEVRDGRVRVLSSPCPGQLCRRAGWAGAGGVLVCVPGGVVVRVPGRRAGDVDAVTR